VFASKIPITMFIVTLVYRIATFGQIECNVTVFSQYLTLNCLVLNNVTIVLWTWRRFIIEFNTICVNKCDLTLNDILTSCQIQFTFSCVALFTIRIISWKCTSPRYS